MAKTASVPRLGTGEPSQSRLPRRPTDLPRTGIRQAVSAWYVVPENHRAAPHSLSASRLPVAQPWNGRAASNAASSSACRPLM